MSLRAAILSLRATGTDEPAGKQSYLTAEVRVETLVARAYGSDHCLYCLELGGGLTLTDEPTGKDR